MSVLNKTTIFGAKDQVVETVAVPEWGGDVLVKGLTGAERDRYEASILRMHGDKMVPNLEHVRAKLVVAAAVQEDGSPLFDESDYLELSSKSARALQRVFDKARELAGLKDEDVNELVAGLKPTQGDGSNSDSH